MSSKEIFALRRQGQSGEALNLARQQYLNFQNDEWFIRAYGWALYDHVKKIVQDYENGQIYAAVLNNQLSPLMQEFSRIGNPLRRDMCFSQFLTLANKVAKDWNEFLYFARWVGVDSFSDDDEQPYTTDNGDRIAPLAERFIRAIAREVTNKYRQINDNELLTWGKSIIKYALEKYPNDQWLYYYQSKVFLAENDTQSAIKFLIPVIHRQSKSAWIWALLGSILNNNPEQSLICYIHATQIAREEQELAKIRIILANKLVQLSRYNKAGYQVKKALEYRANNNFRLTDELLNLKNSQWYNQVENENSFKPCDIVKNQAKELIVDLDKDNIYYERYIIDHHNTHKEMTYVVNSLEKGTALFHKKFSDIAKLEIGTAIDIAFSKIGQKRPLSYKVSDEGEIAGFCQVFSGQVLKKSEQNFAFLKSNLDGVFIPPNLCQSFENDTEYKVQCLAIKSKNKQGKIGWRAIRILTVN
ncbi:MAG: hypothetical protein Q4A69_07885 [Moraxella sp.]|nr:hypothetical protein [Moraxella sp.]